MNAKQPTTTAIRLVAAKPTLSAELGLVNLVGLADPAPETPAGATGVMGGEMVPLLSVVPLVYELALLAPA